ncbi:MAG: CHAD domain-containing protein [Actinomycetes bacterium]
MGAEPVAAEVRATRVHKRDAAGDAIRAHLAHHVSAFIDQDARVRRDEPDAVHQMRVAARQLRSSLQVFSPLVDRTWATHLRTELDWAADDLGLARDTEVLLDRLTAHIADLPEAQRELARRVVNETLSARLRLARTESLASLDSPRHQELIDALAAAVKRPQLTKAAREPCSKALPPLFEKSWRSLNRIVADLNRDSPARDWHKARIAAKRTRYAAEFLAPIFGGRVDDFAHAMSRITNVLGDTHDANVAQMTLEQLATQPDADRACCFALGMLSANELLDERSLRADFTQVWPVAVKAHKRTRSAFR